ncbi:MAG: hypothetical protein IT318_21345 [Anaerolineales bacterium]|nr:hypothetical protein [Anaerolineales bacterium]
MERITWKKIIRSWWGRSLAGAFVGGLLVAFSGLDQPAVFILGMLVGAVALFLLGRWE